VGSHPLNLTVRFLLEIAVWVAAGAFGWQRFDGVWRWIAVIGFPLGLMTLWGTFAVPNDPSRGGTPLVPVPGVVRLFLELAVFGAGVACMHAIGQTRWAIALTAVTVAHYALSWDRIAWLCFRANDQL